LAICYYKKKAGWGLELIVFPIGPNHAGYLKVAFPNSIAIKYHGPSIAFIARLAKTMQDYFMTYVVQ
jgi:hypothetical protein